MDHRHQPAAKNPAAPAIHEWKAGDLRLRTLVMLAVGLALRAHGEADVSPIPPVALTGTTGGSWVEKVVLPPSVPDPIEPFNRVIWDINKGVMTGVIKPTSRVYRFVIVKPVRTSISNFGRNLTYPGRLINNLLQGKWDGARDETYRFGCNTTVGIAGLFDVATRWKIAKSDADFGQTFGQWGWQPACFIMLPLFGPSNERDTVGLAADTAANPLLYISPYEFAADDPLTYLGPYSYLSYAIGYNNLSDSVDEYVRFSQTEMDPYSEIQYAWTFVRANRVADFKVRGKTDLPSLETLQSVFFTFQDPEFPDRGQTRSVLIPATARHLKFTYWLQPGTAKVVYIVPGMGGHRLSESSLALAELVYKNGFSAVLISSPFHAEFMENAATAALPAYLPVDGHDLQAALTGVDRHLNQLYPGRLGSKALMGYSMGALETLYLAATAPTNTTPLLKFSRYVAINPPVRLLHGVAMLDEFYRAPLGWPPAERTNNLENTFLKVAVASQNTLKPQTSLPFSAIESKFLIGFVFRLTLRDVIYSSQRRNNQGILHHALWNLRRDPAYQEILQYSFQDYFDQFVVPYYQTRGLASPVAETLSHAGDLRTYAAGLRANPDIRIIGNENDFLLETTDLDWLRTTFPPGQLTLFPQGGHLGNLSNPVVQKALINALDDLPPTQGK